MPHKSATLFAWRSALDLTKPQLMGIVNATPDSFYDGGSTQQQLIAQALIMVQQGATLLDIGGESTRPGAVAVDAAEELRRVLPVIEALARELAGCVILSIDTTKPSVASAALAAGCRIINDVSGASDPAMLKLAASTGAGLILMHRLTTPAHDRYSTEYGSQAPHYGDVVQTVASFLQARTEAALTAGVRSEQIAWDVGLGFGKSAADNQQLIARTRELAAYGYPLVSALSRKSFTAPGHAPSSAERLIGTLRLSQQHAAAGAHIFRVHDVAEHAAVLWA